MWAALHIRWQPVLQFTALTLGANSMATCATFVSERVLVQPLNLRHTSPSRGMFAGLQDLLRC